MLKLKFIYTEDDYFQIIKFKNSDNPSQLKGRLVYKFLIPLLILVIVYILWPYIYLYSIPSLMLAGLLIILWLTFSNAIYKNNFEKSLLIIAKQESSNNLECISEVEISVNENGLEKRLQGYSTNVEWSFIKNIHVTSNFIFINLKNKNIISIPTRSFNDSGLTKDDFLNFINSKI